MFDQDNLIGNYIIVGSEQEKVIFPEESTAIPSRINIPSPIRIESTPIEIDSFEINTITGEVKIVKRQTKEMATA